jgi:hypothetical protein
MTQNGIPNGVNGHAVNGHTLNGHVKEANGVHHFDSIADSVAAFGARLPSA